MRVKAVERLRERLRENTDWATEIPNTQLHRAKLIAEYALEAIDEVVTEINERFVELPRDRDGKVMMVGTYMVGWSDSTGKIAVKELRFGDDGWLAMGVDDDGYEWVQFVSELSLYTPPTIGGLLREFAEKHLIEANVPKVWRVDVSDELVNEYVDAISEMTSDETPEETPEESQS